MNATTSSPSSGRAQASAAALSANLRGAVRPFAMRTVNSISSRGSVQGKSVAMPPFYATRSEQAPGPAYAGAMTTVLLTGFEPFAGDRANPSGDAVRAVAAQWQCPERLVTAVLPVTFDGAAAQLRALVAEHRPDAVIMTGLAGGRAAVGIERVAVNLQDARIPDNAGAQPVDEPSVPGGAAAAFSTLPVKAIVRAVRTAGIPGELSLTAGTFVCNHVFYVGASLPGPRAGFIHVPWATGHAPGGEPELPLADIARALEIAIRTTLDTPVDVSDAGGTLH